MKKFFCRYASVGALAGSLALAGGLAAQERDKNHEDSRAQQAEDRVQNDSHQWNAQEDQAYRRYLQEHHKKYHDFAKASKKEQNDYWKWRRDHPDEDRR